MGVSARDHRHRVDRPSGGTPGPWYATAFIALAGLFFAGCGAGMPADEMRAEGERPDMPPLNRASSEPLPGRFGFGRPASAEEVARLDIDIMPDGTGLPDGRGTPAIGAAVYSATCASCHGPEGEGVQGLGNTLVGRNENDAFDWSSSYRDSPPRTIGNYWPYAATVFDYVRRAMPFDRPGSLTDDEVYAVTAWLLWKNELIGEDDVMDAASLFAVDMPGHGHFVMDDRMTSPTVR